VHRPHRPRHRSIPPPVPARVRSERRWRDVKEAAFPIWMMQCVVLISLMCIPPLNGYEVTLLFR